VTLILGLLTDQYVALVSDRRVTWRVGRTIKRQEDTDTKTIVICGHFLMGFTGIARIRGLRMERWVSDVLSNVEPDPDAITNRTFDALRDAATAEFGRLSSSEQQTPHTFLIVGYVNDQDTGDLRPVRLVISNSLNEQGQLVANPTGPAFDIAFERLGNRRQLLTPVGYAVPRDIRRQADNAVRRTVRRFPDNPLPAVDTLVQCLRGVAEGSKGWVGKNAMVATLPRRVVPASRYRVPFSPITDGGSDLLAGYVRAEAKTANEAEFYGPAVVCPRMHIGDVQMDPERIPGQRWDRPSGRSS
jgi:hypothetical protein